MQLPLNQPIFEKLRLRLDEQRVIRQRANVRPLRVLQQQIISLEQNDIVVDTHRIGDHVVDISIVNRKIRPFAAHCSQLLLHQIGIESLGRAFDKFHRDRRAVAHRQMRIEISIREVEAVH